MIDTHVHLSHYKFDGDFPYLAYENGVYTKQSGNRELLIQRIKDAGVSAVVEPAISLESNEKLLALAQQNDGFIFVAVGVHPTRTYCYRVPNPSKKNDVHKTVTVKLPYSKRRNLQQYAVHPAVVAIGETGLDYHQDRLQQHRLRQKRWFVYQIKLAHRRGLPLVLHVRDAHGDALKILKKYKKYLCGGVCHCFCSTPEVAKEYVALGFHLGIGGALLADSLGRNALERAIVQTPLSALVLETDAPYVKPDCPDLTGKQRNKARNTSLILPAVISRIAVLKQTTPAEVERITTQNAAALFHLEDKGV